MSQFRIDPKGDPYSQLTMFVDEFTHDAGLSAEQVRAILGYESWEMMYEQARDNRLGVIKQLKDLVSGGRPVQPAPDVVSVYDADKKAEAKVKRKPQKAVRFFNDAIDMLLDDELSDADVGNVIRGLFRYHKALNKGVMYEYMNEDRGLKTLYKALLNAYTRDCEQSYLKSAKNRSNKTGEPLEYID